MRDELTALIDRARKIMMSCAQQEQQRRSFVYGNTKIENDRVTREMVDEQAESVTAPASVSSATPA